MTDNQILTELRKIYGNYIVCTNGLFHLIDDRHNETYINKFTYRPDMRGKYRTLAVLDNIVIAELIGGTRVKYVIFDKQTLTILYKTFNEIRYIDKSILCDVCKNMTIIISHLGRKICTLPDITSLTALGDNKYLLKSIKPYGDRILYYDKQKANLIDLTEYRNYIINRIEGSENQIEIIFMQGVTYIYDFETNICKNKFTGKEEYQTLLWRVV